MVKPYAQRVLFAVKKSLHSRRFTVTMMNLLIVTYELMSTQDLFTLSLYIYVPLTSFTTSTAHWSLPWVTRRLSNVEQEVYSLPGECMDSSTGFDLVRTPNLYLYVLVHVHYCCPFWFFREDVPTFSLHFHVFITSWYLLYEEFEYNKGVIRIRKSKDRQHNDKK